MQKTVMMLLLVACGLCTTTAVGDDVKFTEYKTGYSLKILNVSKIKKYHFVFQDLKSFAATFDTSNNRSRFYKGPKIDEERFRKSLVVGVLKIGKAKFQVTVRKVVQTEGVLQVHYKSEILRKQGLIRSQRLLLSVPKAGVKTVVFFENGQAVKKLTVE